MAGDFQTVADWKISQPKTKGCACSRQLALCALQGIQSVFIIADVFAFVFGILKISLGIFYEILHFLLGFSQIAL
ncbi:MAG: hypothetical protein J6D37_09310 [Clostridia bacterium]|nr:hypothetical protein [Clostridia bacterium]